MRFPGRFFGAGLPFFSNDPFLVLIPLKPSKLFVLAIMELEIALFLIYTFVILFFSSLSSAKTIHLVLSLSLVVLLWRFEAC